MGFEYGYKEMIHYKDPAHLNELEWKIHESEWKDERSEYLSDDTDEVILKAIKLCYFHKKCLMSGSQNNLVAYHRY